MNNNNLNSIALGKLAIFASVKYSWMDHFWNGGAHKPDEDEFVRVGFRTRGFEGDFDEYEFQQWIYDQNILKDEEMKCLGMENYKIKTFLCVWGVGYHVCDGSKVKTKKVHMSFFTDDNGFDEENINEIQSLRLGESLNCKDMLSVMSVVRLT